MSSAIPWNLARQGTIRIMISASGPVDSDALAVEIRDLLLIHPNVLGAHAPNQRPVGGEALGRPLLPGSHLLSAGDRGVPAAPHGGRRTRGGVEGPPSQRHGRGADGEGRRGADAHSRA
jgi:hypothetical protein